MADGPAGRRRRGSGPPAEVTATAADAEREITHGVSRPRLWPEPAPGEQPRAFDRLQSEEGPFRAPATLRRRSYIAVALLVLGAVCIAAAVVVPSWWLVPPGVLIGLAGAVLALRSRIFTAVTVGQSPTSGGRG